MDKDPKKSDDLQDEDGQQGMMSTNIPLTIAVSAFINSKDWFNWILHAAETLVIFYLAYQIIGKCYSWRWLLLPFLYFILAVQLIVTTLCAIASWMTAMMTLAMTITSITN